MARGVWQWNSIFRMPWSAASRITWGHNCKSFKLWVSIVCVCVFVCVSVHACVFVSRDVVAIKIGFESR